MFHNSSLLLVSLISQYKFRFWYSLWRASAFLFSTVVVIAVIAWRNSFLHSVSIKAVGFLKVTWDCLLCGAVEQHLNSTYRDNSSRNRIKLLC